MNKKRSLCLLASLCVSMLLLAACGGPANQTVKPAGSGTVTATATSSPSGSATPTPFVCDSKASAKIEADVAAFIKANYPQQKQHINYEAKGCTLVLVGWANNATDWQDILIGVGKIQNVSGTNYNDFYPSANNPLPRPVNGQCAAGTIKCGDFCIPDTDKCNITAGDIEPIVTPTR